MVHLYLCIKCKIPDQLLQRVHVILHQHTVILGIERPYDTPDRTDGFMYPLVRLVYLLIGLRSIRIHQHLRSIERHSRRGQGMSHRIVYVAAYPLAFLKPRILLGHVLALRYLHAELPLIHGIERRALKRLLEIGIHLKILKEPVYA